MKRTKKRNQRCGVFCSIPIDLMCICSAVFRFVLLPSLLLSFIRWYLFCTIVIHFYAMKASKCKLLWREREKKRCQFPHLSTLCTSPQPLNVHCYALFCNFMLLFRSKIDSVAIRTFVTENIPAAIGNAWFGTNGKTENHTSILAFRFVSKLNRVRMDSASFYIHKQINANEEYPKRKYQITAVDMILNNIIQNIYQVPLNCTIRELCAIYRRTCTITDWHFLCEWKPIVPKRRKNVNINRHTHKHTL